MEQWFSKRGPLGTINITWELVRMYFACLDPRRHESLSLESGIDPLRVILLPLTLTLTSTARD